MKLLFVLLAALACANADVTQLGDSDFKDTLKDMKLALVMFYAPWCGHCKRLKPEFETASETLKTQNIPAKLVKVDCTTDGEKTCGLYGVSGYPTLKIFRYGEISEDYDGPREANGIVKHMKSQVGPASKELKSDAALKEHLEKTDEVVIVGTFKDDGSDLKTFQKVADKNRKNYQFAHHVDTDAEESTIQLHRPKKLHTKLEECVVTFSGEINIQAIEKFIKDNYHGLVGLRRDPKDFTGMDVAVVYFDVDYIKNTKGTNYWRNRVMLVAKKYPGIKFAISDKDEMQREMVDQFGLKWNNSPLVGLRDAKGNKYVMDGVFSVDSFKQFINDFKAETLTPYMKSEEIPAEQGNVKVAVGKNFHALVDGKDYLIEFYAPWCGHCKKLEPEYNELGDKMADEEVLIVKMDATANDVPPDFKVRGFPTIYWVKAAGKPEQYEGGRETDDFVKFIAGKVELKGYDKSGKPKKAEL